MSNPVEQYAAIDIGGSKVLAGIVSASGTVTARAEVRRPATGPEGVLDAARSLLDNLLGGGGAGGSGGGAGGAGGGGASDSVPARVGALGVATAGVVDHASGRILSAVETIPRWAGTEVGRILEEHTGLPTVVENDVNAVAIAEYAAGAAAGAASVLAVAVGTGIGGALVLDGRLHRGASSSAGELGHLPVDVFGNEQSGGRCSCGRTGHLESVAAGPAIAAGYARRAGIPSATLEEVARAMATGDERATAAVADGATALGRMLGGLANAFDPDVMILFGGVLALGAPYLRQVEAALRAEALPGPSSVRLATAALGNDAGLIGAAFSAAERLRSQRDAHAGISGGAR